MRCTLPQKTCKCIRRIYLSPPVAKGIRYARHVAWLPRFHLTVHCKHFLVSTAVRYHTACCDARQQHGVFHLGRCYPRMYSYMSMVSPQPPRKVPIKQHPLQVHACTCARAPCSKPRSHVQVDQAGTPLSNEPKSQGALAPPLPRVYSSSSRRRWRRHARMDPRGRAEGAIAQAHAPHPSWHVETLAARPHPQHALESCALVIAALAPARRQPSYSVQLPCTQVTSRTRMSGPASH